MAAAKNLLQKGVIQRIDTPTNRCSPAFFVPKADGVVRMLALSASQFVGKKKSQRIYTSVHSAGLELTKLTYTRLEDNLIRHRGDRPIKNPDCRPRARKMSKTILS